MLDREEKVDYRFPDDPVAVLEIAKGTVNYLDKYFNEKKIQRMLCQVGGGSPEESSVVYGVAQQQRKRGWGRRGAESIGAPEEKLRRTVAHRERRSLARILAGEDNGEKRAALALKTLTGKRKLPSRNGLKR